jgi:hypothetical protein
MYSTSPAGLIVKRRGVFSNEDGQEYEQEGEQRLFHFGDLLSATALSNSRPFASK